MGICKNDECGCQCHSGADIKSILSEYLTEGNVDFVWKTLFGESYTTKSELYDLISSVLLDIDEDYFFNRYELTETLTDLIYET